MLETYLECMNALKVTPSDQVYSPSDEPGGNSQGPPAPDVITEIGANERRAQRLPSRASNHGAKLSPLQAQGTARIDPIPSRPSSSFLYAFASVLNDLPCITASLSGNYLISPCLSLPHRPLTAPSPQHHLAFAPKSMSGSLASGPPPSQRAHRSPPTPLNTVALLGLSTKHSVAPNSERLSVRLEAHRHPTGQ
ncbi:hypothetical protein DFP72DRAFT_1139239 [Ephemerocybe angulata]|uniref:Uncharacterized protein n=1 Tax=Ephemerocybe angulata TaxID=980116 RepID=A0A8H6M266_9AGAR|nr:hypothetical protein DFP72DRAFT_1139239 [Tulosesus angulatus]